MSARAPAQAAAFINRYSLEVGAKALPALRAEADRIPPGTTISIPYLASEDDNARLAAAGYGAVGRAVLHDHARLAELVQPGTADCVLFNFGWLPGAEHDVHSTADGSVPALRAALEALRPGGVLAAVLYSGKVIGDAEKQAALAFFKALPLTQYTVLVCEFANWAQTAPLPCFVIKK